MARGKWISGAERLRIADLDALGLSVGAIAEQVGRSYWSVYRVVQTQRKRVREEKGDELGPQVNKRAKKAIPQQETASQTIWHLDEVLDSIPMPTTIARNCLQPLQVLDATIESEIWRLRSLCQMNAADPRKLQELLNFQTQVWLLATATK